MQSKDRTYQVVAIVGLIVGVMALTIGFAAFTTTLTIQSAAEVAPGAQTLDVVFSTSSNSVAAGSVSGVATGESGASGDSATLSGTSITGIKANFTKPGQTVTYTFNVYNNSAYTAYLNEVIFKNVTGSSPAAFKVCSAKSGSANPATNNIDTACNGITLTLTVDDLSTTTSKTPSEILALGNKTIAASVGKTVTVVIEYATGSAVPDGDISVAFGDIELKYSSVAPSA